MNRKADHLPRGLLDPSAPRGEVSAGEVETCRVLLSCVHRFAQLLQLQGEPTQLASPAVCSYQCACQLVAGAMRSYDPMYCLPATSQAAATLPLQCPSPATFQPHRWQPLEQCWQSTSSRDDIVNGQTGYSTSCCSCSQHLPQQSIMLSYLRASTLCRST